MIEGQEERFLERVGSDREDLRRGRLRRALPFRSLCIGLRHPRARLARRVGDARRSRCRHHAAPARDDGVAGDVPSPVRGRAQLATTVDHISGGRVEVGIGAGWYELEHQAFGFPFSDLSTRLELFAEQLEIVYRQFTEESFRFHGKHFTLEDCRANPKPLQTCTRRSSLAEPQGAARSSRRPLRDRVQHRLRHGGRLSSAKEQARRRVRAHGPRSGDASALLMTAAIVAEDDAVLQQRIARVEAVTGGDSTPEEVRRMIEEASIVGTVDQVVERLQELEAAGVERIMLQHLAHDDLEMVSLIGREVIPRVS